MENLRIIESEKLKVENLGFGCLGNGTTVWDRTREKNNDYIQIAHITDAGVISWRKVTISKEQKEHIEAFAEKLKPV